MHTPESRKNDPKNSSTLQKIAKKILQEGKHFGTDLYEDGMEAIYKAEEQLESYKDECVHVVKKHPMASLLVAGGIGALLYMLIKKED